MAYKAIVTDAQRFDSLADGRTYIDVTYQVLDEDTDALAGEYRESFSLKTTPEQIQAHLEKKLETFDEERARAEEQREIDESLEQADTTIEAIKGVEIIREKDKKEK